MLEISFVRFCPIWTRFYLLQLSLASNTNVQLGNRYYLVIHREIMLDRADKVI